MVIEFGDWQLRKKDADNWELYHRHATKETRKSVRAGTAGKARWHPCGRYYQASTFHHAIQYAIDRELREGSDVVSLQQFLKDYRAMLDEYRSAFGIAD